MDRNSYEALRERAAWIDLTGRGNIRATGEDRVRLLHSMTTNDIQTLVPGDGCYTFFLTAQGRILADANIFAMTDYLLIDTEPETKQRVFEHLEKFIIADDVTCTISQRTTQRLAWRDPHAEECSRHCGMYLRPTCRAQSPNGITAKSLMSATQASQDIHFVPCEHMEEHKRKAYGSRSDSGRSGTADVVRIENGKPRYGVDITDSSLPQETQQMHAVHPSKGCYHRPGDRGACAFARPRESDCLSRWRSRLPNRPRRRKDRSGRQRSRHDNICGFIRLREDKVAIGILRNEAMNSAVDRRGLLARQFGQQRTRHVRLSELHIGLIVPMKVRSARDFQRILLAHIRDIAATSAAPWSEW